MQKRRRKGGETKILKYSTGSVKLFIYVPIKSIYIF